jgi:hypothetical protein
MRFGRPGRRVPADVASVVGPRERLLAWSELTDGGWIVASDTRIRMTNPVVDLSWVDVVGAGWDSPVLTLRLYVPQGERQVQASVVEGRTLPQVVRERVEETLLVQTKVAIDDRRGVRFLARRVPGTGETLWQQIADVGLDTTDTRVQSRITAAQAELSELFGV